MPRRLFVHDHARREMDEEPFGTIHADEVLQALDTGQIIEDYATDTPYPSCLVLGRTRAGRVLHIVCAPVQSERRLIVVTAYQPDPERWEVDFKRRKR
jgi:hypothetical protein